MKTLFVLLASLSLPSSVWALPPHQTVVYSGTPDSARIADWSTRPGTRAYVLQMSDPTTAELDSLGPLLAPTHVDRLEVEIDHFPGEDAVAAWRRLASRGAELVVMGAGIPTEGEISHLNTIGFTKIHLVITTMPGLEEARRVGTIHSAVALTLATGMYPRYVDRPIFQALPAAIPLTFTNSYWPYFVHMDVLNLLTQPEHLRVSGMFPPADEIPYLQNCKNVRDVLVETDFEPTSPEIWKAFGKLPVHWSMSHRVPAESALTTFEASREFGPRRLTVDTDSPIDELQMRRLVSSPLSIEWVHSE